MYNSRFKKKKDSKLERIENKNDAKTPQEKDVRRRQNQRLISQKENCYKKRIS